MKNLMTKIIQIAQVVFSVILVIMLVLTVLGVLPLPIINNKVTYDSYLKVIIVIFAIIYAVLSTYLIINVFADSNKLKYIKFDGDEESLSYVSTKTVMKMCKKIAKKLENIKVYNLVIYSDDLTHTTLNLSIGAVSDDIKKTSKEFKLALQDCFEKILKIKFNKIIIKVKKLKSTYEPNIDKITTSANDLEITKQNEQDKEIINEDISQLKSNETIIINKSDIIEDEVKQEETDNIVVNNQDILDEKGNDEQIDTLDNSTNINEDTLSKNINIEEDVSVNDDSNEDDENNDDIDDVSKLFED